MISRTLRETARHADGDFLVDGASALTWDEAAEAVEARARAWSDLRGRRVAMSLGPRVSDYVDLLALDRVGARTYLVAGLDPPEGLEALCARLGIDAVLAWDAGRRGSDPRPLEVEGEVVLFTSGTTGTPKAALHAWSALIPTARPASARWLLTYGGASFAGLQVFLQVLASGATLILGEGGPAALARRAIAARADHVSATPTFYRMLLATTPAEVLQAWRPAQLTLGGEAVGQGILDALTAAFPAARLTHIYASTEMGVCFSVHDGRAGFPASWLDAVQGVELKVALGMLHIRSPRAMKGYLGEEAPADGFFATGDLVEVQGDRVVFLGRHEERINVGGRKVQSGEVERVLTEVPGVQAARVSGAPSSVTGQIVRAEVVAAPGADLVELRVRLLAHCRAHLAAHQVPRIVAFVASLPLTASGKVVRS